MDITSTIGQRPSRRAAIFVKSAGFVSSVEAEGPSPRPLNPWQDAQELMKTVRPDEGLSGEHPIPVKSKINNTRFMKSSRTTHSKHSVRCWQLSALILINAAGENYQLWSIFLLSQETGCRVFLTMSANAAQTDYRAEHILCAARPQAKSKGRTAPIASDAKLQAARFRKKC